MTPSSARELRRKRVAQLRRDEPDLSVRAMAQRLGLSRDTVRRDLEELERQGAQSAPPGREGAPDVVQRDAPVAQSAPRVPGGGAQEAVQFAPSAGLPRRVAQPLAGVDLSQWPAVRRDLAVLAQTGRTAEALAHQAITALAHHYARALARGDIERGQEFIVSSITLRPLSPAGGRMPEPAGAV